MSSPATQARPWAWRLGSAFGIDLYVHATFLVLIAWVLIEHLGQGHGIVAAARGVLLILSVFAIVILHELGHALTAKRYGIGTRDITLYPFGGIARLERMPSVPVQEILVALAGPAVNFALAALFLGAVALTGGFEEYAPRVVGGSFLWKMVWINASLGVFNMVPAFPMDGGRVLRGLLAIRLGHTRATEIAARVGQALALAIGAAGLFLGPTLLFIAFFVWIGAHQEAAAAEIKAELSGVSVESAMISRFETLAPDDVLQRAVTLTLGGFQQDFPVVRDGRLVGLLGASDLVRGLAREGPRGTVSRWMRTELLSARPEETIDRVLERFQDAPLVVLGPDGELAGMLSAENVGELLLLRRAQSRATSAPRPALGAR